MVRILTKFCVDSESAIKTLSYFKKLHATSDLQAPSKSKFFTLLSRKWKHRKQNTLLTPKLPNHKQNNSKQLKHSSKALQLHFKNIKRKFKLIKQHFKNTNHKSKSLKVFQTH